MAVDGIPRTRKPRNIGRMSEKRLSHPLASASLAALLAALVGAAIPFVACSGADTAPADAGSDAPTSDGDLPGDDAGDAMAPTDAGDAGDPADAMPDAMDDGDAAAEAGRDLSNDATKFFGDSRCAQASVQLCEDFESGKLDTTTWTVTGDKPVVDGLQHARGNKALHITKVGNGASYIKETKTFPATNNTYFGRMFVYFESLPIAPMPYAHWTFAAASGTGANGQIRLSGQLSKGLNHFGVGTDTGTNDAGSGDWTSSDKDPNGMPDAVPLKKWLCIEWMHKGDTSETRFYRDATEHPSLYTSETKHGGNTNPYTLPTFTNVWMGWQEYQMSTETFEMWIDEIAIDKERIGCIL